jgi:hypothetical protein
MILIHRSVGDDEAARCFVSNMGAEPIYLVSLIADLDIEGERRSAVITDRGEWREENNPASATTQGPLASGNYLDVGSFKDLMDRADSTVPGASDKAERLVLTAVASYGYGAKLVAARREFALRIHNDRRVIHPTDIITQQLSGPLARRRVKRRLMEDLEEEARALGFD